MLKILLIVFAILIFNGCSWCEKIVEVPKIIKVPVKCKVPIVNCDTSNKNDTELIVSLVECIFNYKDAVKVCE